MWAHPIFLAFSDVKIIKETGHPKKENSILMLLHWMKVNGVQCHFDSAEESHKSLKQHEGE